MKKCPYCGFENPDQAVRCTTCDTALTTESSPAEPGPGHGISREEARFWERMTFRQFALLFLRLQALWLFFYALVDLTYLVRYFGGLALGFPDLAAETRRALFWDILRIVVHVAAGVSIITHGERLLSWLVKDWAAKPQTPKADSGSNSAA